MEMFKFSLIFLIPAFIFPGFCAAREDGPSNRILMEDNYYNIVSKLDNLTKKVDTLELENTALSQEVRDLRAAKGVAFHATLTSSISGGDKRLIVFDHVELNIGNAYNVNHGNFFAPVNGTYLFSIYVCTHPPHTIVLDLVRNGVSVGRLLAGDKDYSNCNSNTFLLELKKGDDVYVMEGTYGDLLAVASNYGKPKFTGILVNAN